MINNAPVVTVPYKNLTAVPCGIVDLKGKVSDPDRDNVTSYWWVDLGGSTYSGTSKGIQVWEPVNPITKFTVPKDAKSGDSFCITLEVTDKADAPMTRYAQVIVKVTAPVEIKK